MFIQYGGAGSAYATGASVATVPHRDDEQFLGLNWKNVVVTIMVGTMAAVVSDLVLYSVHKHYRIRREDY
jgi:hypothetical protein